MSWFTRSRQDSSVPAGACLQRNLKGLELPFAPLSIACWSLEARQIAAA